MRFQIGMAVPALHAGQQRLERELLSGDRICRVAGHAANLVVVAHTPAYGVSQTCWRDVLAAERWAKPLQLLEPTNPALIPLAIFLQNVRLSDRKTGSDSPANGHRNRVCSIRN